MARQRSYKAEKVIERLVQNVSRQIALSLAGCVHCGMCTESCHYVLANPGDVTYAPAHKADRIRKIFKRHVDWTGRVVPWWVGADSIFTDEQLEELKDIAFGKCTNCRRCTFNCPMGVDFATVNGAVRGLLVGVGVMPEGVAVVSKDQWEVGNQMGVLKEDYLETLEWMEEEVREELGDPNFRIPVDEPDCEVVYAINPREVKYDPRTIADAAKIFYLAKEKWTMASEGWDMTNFGLFSGDKDLGGTVARRVYETMSHLRGKRLVISECGHGFRATRCEGPNWAQWDVDFEIESSIFTMLRYIKQGRLKVDPGKNREPVTYHDSCNLARSCGITEEPRELLRLVCQDFREMYPNRAQNFCCTGGGGAMSMAEYTPRRLKSAKIKAEQLEATGAKVVVTSCHNCVDGLNDLIRHYKLGMKVTQLVNLVADAAVVERKVAVHVPEKVALALEGYRVMVVDDEPDVCTFLGTVLQDNGATVYSANSAQKALELLAKDVPHLLTLDLAMPQTDGIKMFEQLKKDPRFSDMKVLIVTGHPELTKLIYERPVPPPDGYMDKPVEEEAFLKNVKKVLKISAEAS